MINIDVAERLEQLEKDGKLTPEMRELATFAFERGYKAGESKQEAKAKSEATSQQDGNGPTESKWVESKGYASTAVPFHLDGTTDIRLDIENYSNGKQVHFRQAISNMQLQMAHDPAMYLRLVLENIYREVLSELTTDKIRKDLL